jgi:hypothetical protein
MNAAGSVRPVMKKLGAVAARTGCAILLVGHLGKKGGRAQYRGLGSIDIYSAARSVLTVGRIPDEENLRAMVHNKTNLAPFGASQAFSFDPAAGFTWQGEYDITIDELLNPKKTPDSQLAKARRLIEKKLANGPVAAIEIMEIAEEQGISERTLKRAKSALGVLSEKRNGQWFWSLPVEVAFEECQEGQGGQEGQECHAESLALLAPFPHREAG